MKLSATIKVPGHAKELKRLFEAETSSRSKRAGYKTEVKGSDFLIRVSADDSTAFRAIISSLSKLLSVYEKTSALNEK